jgi:hypothetical protein
LFIVSVWQKKREIEKRGPYSPSPRWVSREISAPLRQDFALLAFNCPACPLLQAQLSRDTRIEPGSEKA